MAITGTGTSADPYVVTTWAEFIATTADGVYIKLPDGGGTFDMNDYYPQGITSTISLRGFINGNGWTIKNAAAYTSTPAFQMSTSSQNGKLSNLNFENFRQGFSPTSSANHAMLIACGTGYSGEALYRCKFSGLLQNTNDPGDYYTEIINLGTSATIEQCSFNIKSTGAGRVNVSLSTSWSAKLNNCNVKLDCEGAFFGLYMNNTYVTGEAGSIGFTQISTDSVIDCNSTLINHAAWGTNSNVLINTDKYTGTIPSDCTGVTAAQLKDADYLSSIGFPIQT